MGLTVLSVAYPFAPVSEDAAGGAEQVLAMVDAGLVRRAHRSIVIACEGSRAAGELHVTTAADRIDDHARRAAWRRHGEAIARVLAREPVDVVHLHGLDFEKYLPPPGPLVVVTLHLPPSFYAGRALRPARPATHLVCVSRAQRSACPPDSALGSIVPNGVAVDELSRDEPVPLADRRYVAALGRICPEKGLHLALDAASLAGFECRLAGRVFGYESHQRHFAEQIRPRLDARRVYLGPVGFHEKGRLLAGARCLLVPSLVDETSCLVAMEALACGTPVVAYARGALPEIVEPGRTGFLVHDVPGMARAIAQAGELDPAACRAVARVRFSARTMVDRYLDLYGRLLRQGTTHEVGVPSAVLNDRGRVPWC